MEAGGNKYLGYALFDHLVQTLAIFAAMCRRIGSEHEEREHLTLGQVLWTYTLYARCYAEFPAAVWPPHAGRMAESFARAQATALRGLLGPLCHPAAAGSMLALLFDLDLLAERQVLGSATSPSR